MVDTEIRESGGVDMQNTVFEPDAPVAPVVIPINRVAKALGGVAPDTVRKWSRDGALPPVRKIGGRWFMGAAEFEAFLAELRAEVGETAGAVR